MSENPYGGVDSYAVSYTSYKARVLLRTPHFNKDDLEDIKQELMLAYLLAWPGFDPSKGHPKSFIKTVINNRAAEMLRSTGSAETLVGREEYLLVHVGPQMKVRTIGSSVSKAMRACGVMFSAPSVTTSSSVRWIYRKCAFPARRPESDL